MRDEIVHDWEGRLDNVSYDDYGLNPSRMKRP